MKKWVWIGIIAAVVLFIGIGLFYAERSNISGQAVRASSAALPTKPVAITYSNIENYLSQTPMVKAVPSNGVIMLKFFNFDRGYREWEKSYVIKTGSAKEGFAADPDILLTLHSKYLQEMNTNNFCSVIKKANAAGDLGFESPLSTLKLSWKFRSLSSYRDCFGF
ncbi:MAG: hypothetical protein MUF61_01360 [archaeon]|jgi:hypothetical protein|nr:hypothetical protein [archaeon]